MDEEWVKFRIRHTVEVDAEGMGSLYFSNARCAIRTAHHLIHYGDGYYRLTKRLKVRVISQFENLNNAEIERQYTELGYEQAKEERMAS